MDPPAKSEIRKQSQKHPTRITFSMEEALRRAMEVARREYQEREEEFGPQFEEDRGFSLRRSVTENTDSNLRGVDSTWANGMLVGDERLDTLAARLRGLNDIPWM